MNKQAKPVGTVSSSSSTTKMTTPVNEAKPISENSKVHSVQSYKPVYLPKATVSNNTTPATVTPVLSNRKTPFIPPAVKNSTSLPTESAPQPTVQTKQPSKTNRSMRIAAYPVSSKPVTSPIPISPLKAVETTTPAVKHKEPAKHVYIPSPPDP